MLGVNHYASMSFSLTWSARFAVTVAIVSGFSSSAIAWERAAAKHDDRPNLVVIMADDLGAAELGCYGNRKHRTPHLDRLAAGGMRFRTCWSTPLCTPTRVLIMTGQYGFRTGYYNFIHRAYSPTRTSALYDIGSKTTFADLLKDAGYATGCVGKWQLTGDLPSLVHDCGFQEYMVWTWLHKLPEGIQHSGGWQSKAKRVPSRFWHPGILSNGRYVPTRETDYGSDLYTDFAIDFMKRHRDGPFVLYFPMALTHTPWDATPDLKKPGEKTAKGLRTNVEYMDHLVGRIVKTLDELSLRKNTIVMFTGDNGTQGAGKAQVTEAGARVPLIVNCPGRVKGGVVSDELVDLSDVLPTLVDYANAKIPKNHLTDGHSLRLTFEGKPGAHREWIFSYLANRRMLRDRRWLLEGSGRFFDCGKSRNGKGYRDVTLSTAREVVAARKRFEKLLEDLPAPSAEQDLVQTGKKASNKPKKKKRKRPIGKLEEP
jgi:arylsulfatase A